MLGGPCHCWARTRNVRSDLQPEESFLAAWAPGQVLIQTGGLAMPQARITATAVWEMGICECFWGEVVEKQARFPQTGLAAVKLLGNVLQMKKREILVCLKRLTNWRTHECFLSQSFASQDRRDSTNFKTQQKILAKGRPPFSLRQSLCGLWLPTELWPCAPPYLYQMAFPDRAGPSRTSSFV